MNKRFPAKSGTASPAQVAGSCTMCGQMSKKVPNGKNAGVRVQSRDGKERQGPGCVITNSQVPRERLLPTVSPLNETPRSHQRRWSVSVTSPVITVKKNKKEPQPPQRGVSLLGPQTTTHSYFKRYSCPPIWTGHPSSSSSSSSATSSCSSPPPVQTSVITGQDPLGWKIQPKSSSSSSRAHAKRLSLQIPLPVIPVSVSQNPMPSSKTKPALRPKPSRRHHSESSAFLRSPGSPLPVVTSEELLAVHLRPVTFSGESDDVFCETTPGQGTTTPPRIIPPSVPEKTAMARQIAQLIAHSRKRYSPVVAESNMDIYSSVIKPKPKHSPQNDYNKAATKTHENLLMLNCD
ncbi:uncharacterized protein PAE49_001163 [Odontesthes bonariensis]